MPFSNNDVTPTNFLWTKVDAGPTLGLIRRPLFPQRYITADGSLQLFDFQILVKPSPPANITFTLLSVRDWILQAGGGYPVMIQDMMLAGTNSKTITITPYGAEKINNLSSYSIVSDLAGLVIRPLTDYSGWSSQ